MHVYYKKIVLVVIGALACIASYAQRQPVITAMPLVGDSIKAGKTLTVVDSIFFDEASTIAQTKSVSNIVSLHIDAFSDKVLPDSFRIEVQMRVHYALSGDTDTGSVLDTLRVFYSKDRPDTSKATKFYTDYHSVQVEVMNVVVTGAPDSTRRFLVLENMMIIERYFNTSCDAAPTVSMDSSEARSEGELIVSWAALPSVPLYELEWTYIDSSAVDAGNYDTGGGHDADLIFKNNGTRVQLSGTNYRIPLLYDGHGHLFFRVRSLQSAPDNEIIPGAWSSAVWENGLGDYEFSGHERALNWQATTSFAEEGKRKSVLQYYDGSLKARQTVTKDNTTNTTIVAETLYDNQGRPAIQVLPAPTLSNLIGFNASFNIRGINSAEYDKGVYDTLIADNEFCSAAADSMSSTSGAANYYSPMNPLVHTASPDYAHQFVPNAFGFPFTETRYTRDNTGRIDRQSGVGPDFRIGTGHETKYYYGSPTQRELDALFGTEAGDASHYEKNMVRDANGQYSVSYVDMHGRTVATALAGDSTRGMQRLASYDSIQQTDNLLTPANNVIHDNAINSSASILVPVKGTYTFNYSLSPDNLSLDDCSDTPVCYDCLYDLTITISDNCDNQQFGGSPKKITLSNFSLFKEDGTTYNIDTTCTATPIDTSFSVLLEEGSYDISKVLSISKEGMQYYRDSIFIPHNTCKSYQQLYFEMLDSLRARVDCTPDSLLTVLTTAFRGQMMADLTPTTGQYADTSYLSGWYSIFDIGIDHKFNYQTVAGDYRDEDGTISQVWQVDPVTGELKQVSPKQLSAEDFIADFRDSWAETLLPVHPEYPLLQEYEKLKSAYTWEAEFFNTQTFADAVAKGYLNPTGSSTAPASNFTVSGKTDSLFYSLNDAYGSGIVSIAKQALDDSLFHYVKKNDTPQYYTLWGAVTGIVKCNNGDPDCYDTWNENANVFNTETLCEGDLDQAWKLYRAQYLRFREQWIDKYLRVKSGIYADQVDDSCIAVFPDMSNAAIAGVPDEFEGYGGTVNTAGADTLAAANNLDTFLLANCTAYAEKWWEELKPCNYNSEDSAWIISRLVLVAYNGADVDHPFGSSTVKPSSTYEYRSFDEVISAYNEEHTEHDIFACNAYLISNPKPYDQPGILINKPLITAPDSCSCSRINTLYAQFVADSSEYHLFSNYMQATQATVITEGALDTLRNLCSADGDCRYLQQPIILPPSLQCNAGNACAVCVVVRALYDSFYARFDTLPSYADTNIVQSQINSLFEHYMNANLGFSKTYTEYLDFLQTCDTATYVPCGDTTHWTIYNPGTDLQITPDLYVNSSNNIAPPSSFFHDGVFDGPTGEQAGDYILVNKQDSILTGSYNLEMQWRVKPSSLSAMIDPFITRGPVSFYLGAEWIKDVTDTSWWIGKTFIEGSGHSNEYIKGMGIVSNDSGLVADWVKIIKIEGDSTVYIDEFTNHSGMCGPLLCGQQAADSVIILNMKPCADTSFNAQVAANFLFDIYRKKLKGEFEKAYMKKCLDAGRLESFTVRHPVVEYHYTLYYYDQAGNLIKTVPPEGVDLKRDSVWLDEVAVDRAAGESEVPEHRLATTYRYNSLNQVISQHSPDGGLSKFWYDRLGRLVVSQNAKQAEGALYSYTLYDPLGRITEVGQKNHTTAMTDVTARDRDDLKDWLDHTYTLDASTVISEQVTQTVYDVRDPENEVLPHDDYVVNKSFQKSYTLRNRVSYTRYYDKLGYLSVPLVSDYDNSTTYSYDIHGNVDTLLHHYRTGLMADHGYNEFKSIAYKYGLISGKVNEVHYQPGMADQFYHRYEYDAENRLTDVYTADRKEYLGIPALEEHDARYSYYKHGPLAKTILGQKQVQGLDYAYTLQGWLKGVNSDSLVDEDGTSGSIVAKDAYRFSLNYFNGEYHAIGDAITEGIFKGHSGSIPSGDACRPLYNGNISSMVVGIPKLGETRLYNYGYDQLNRIVRMDAYTGYHPSTQEWDETLDNHSGEYKERISYDGNGNILAYLRNGSRDQVNMDSLHYNYNRDGSGYLTNNKLRQVRDEVSAGNYPGTDLTEDLDNQSDADNYSYDAIGNLVADVKEGIDNIEWTVYGKIRKITKANGTEITYTYDVAGNRISKTVKKDDVTTTTWYVRDAQGNPMAIYTGADGKLTLNEHHLYGSSRLGVLNRNIDMDAEPDPDNNIFVEGNKFFELSNHLGNVLVTISDKKTGVDLNSDGIIDYYEAEIATANDYYPFGMLMPDRKYSVGSGYRYGFNGKEKSNEIYGEGNIYDYGFRIYNPLLARFLTTDPLTVSRPWYTPYQFSANMPIVAIDLDGLEDYVVTNYYDKKAKLSETSIAILTERQSAALVNQRLQKSDGTYITKQNVLVRNVSYDGITSYSYQSGLNKQQRDIVAKATKELIKLRSTGGYIYYGGPDPAGGLNADNGEYLETEGKSFGSKQYVLSRYSSKNIAKPSRVKIPNPTSNDSKKEPLLNTSITSTKNLSSSITFESHSKHTNSDVTGEINKIISLVKSPGVTNYSITILGNIQDGGNFGEWNTRLKVFTVYKNYGELALARANTIKEELVARGLDPAKINVGLGDPNKGMTADYQISTTTKIR